MFVSRLDRPWLDSPFPMHGVKVKTASTVATRTLVVLGQELVPYRRRAQAEEEKPKLRLDEASDGRQRTIKRA